MRAPVHDVECRAGEEVWIGETIRIAPIGWDEGVLLICIEAPTTFRLHSGIHRKQLLHRTRGHRWYLVNMPAGAIVRLNGITVSARKLAPAHGLTPLRDTVFEIDPDGERVVRRIKRAKLPHRRPRTDQEET